jgi:hypothetical protein
MTASCDTLAARTRLLERVTAVAALHIGVRVPLMTLAVVCLLIRLRGLLGSPRPCAQFWHQEQPLLAQ